MDPGATEQKVQCESCHISTDATPQAHHFRDDSEPRNCHTHACDSGEDGQEYRDIASFL